MTWLRPNPTRHACAGWRLRVRAGYSRYGQNKAQIFFAGKRDSLSSSVLLEQVGNNPGFKVSLETRVAAEMSLSAGAFHSRRRFRGRLDSLLRPGVTKVSVRVVVVEQLHGVSVLDRHWVVSDVGVLASGRGTTRTIEGLEVPAA